MISSLLLDADAERYVTLDTAVGGAKAPTDDPAANKATEIKVRGDMISESLCLVVGLSIVDSYGRK